MRTINSFKSVSLLLLKHRIINSLNKDFTFALTTFSHLWFGYDLKKNKMHDMALFSLTIAIHHKEVSLNMVWIAKVRSTSI